MNPSAVHPRCAHCGTEITGFTIYWQDGKSYHPECFDSAMEPPKMTESVSEIVEPLRSALVEMGWYTPEYGNGIAAELVKERATIERLQARLAEVEKLAERYRMGICVAMREGLDLDERGDLFEDDSGAVEEFLDYAAEYEPDLAVCRILRGEPAIAQEAGDER